MNQLQVTFQEASLSQLACTALQELNFDAYLVANSKDQVNVFIKGDELTSAIEILQAYGGELLLEPHYFTDLHTFEKSYNMDLISLYDVELEDAIYDDEDMVPISPCLTELSSIDPYIGMGHYEFGALEYELEELDETNHIE